MKIRRSHHHRLATIARILGILCIPATIISTCLADGLENKATVFVFGGLVTTAYSLLASSLPTIWDINNSKN